MTHRNRWGAYCKVMIFHGEHVDQGPTECSVFHELRDKGDLGQCWAYVDLVRYILARSCQSAFGGNKRMFIDSTIHYTITNYLCWSTCPYIYIHMHICVYMMYYIYNIIYIYMILYYIILYYIIVYSIILYYILYYILYIILYIILYYILYYIIYYFIYYIVLY